MNKPEFDINQGVERKENGIIKNSIGIITSPIKTMHNVSEKPSLIFPIILVAFSLFIYYLIRYPLYVDFMKDMTVLKNPSIPADQLELSFKIVPLVGLLLTPFSQLLTWVVTAALILGGIKLFKGQGTFKQYLVIVGYSYVIPALYCVCNLIMSFITGNLLFDASLAKIISPLFLITKGSLFYGFLRGISLFNIWQYAIIAAAVNKVSKVNKAISYVIVATTFVLYVVYKIGNFKYM